MNPYRSLKAPGSPSESFEKLLSSLIRYAIASSLAGLGVMLVPVILDSFDDTGKLKANLFRLPFFRDPFKFAGGAVLLFGLNLFSLVRNVRRRVQRTA